MKRAVQLAIVFIVVLQVGYTSIAAALDEEIIPPTEPTVAVEPAQEKSAKVSPDLPQSTEKTVVKQLAVPLVQEEVAVAEAEEENSLVLPSLLINRVVAGKTGQTAYEYVELYNPNPTDVVLDDWKLTILRRSDDIKQELLINGTVKANSYLLVAGTDSAFDDAHDLRLKTNVIVTTGGIVQLTDTSGTVQEQVQWGDVTSPSLGLSTGNMLERNFIETVPSLTGDNMKDFSSKPLGTTVPLRGGYEPYVEPVNHCSGVKISEIAANVATDKQFIELYNTSNAAVVLDDCLLQTNRSVTTNFTLSGTLKPGEYRAFYITPAGLTLTKTTTGTVYLLSSNGEEETDSRTYDGLTENTSWAWFGGNDWRQTFAVSPGATNKWQEFLPCEAGYERSSETGRCRKKLEEKIVADCGPDKYRNPETNRCRNIEAANALTPCKQGQYRNPETGRCRSLATATSTLKPCKEGQERNPATNRCRNAASSIPGAAFAVEPVAETGKAFMGWWALGGVGALAVGYGAWEWRRDAWLGIQKVASFFTSSK